GDPERQVLVQRVRIDLGETRIEREQRLDLRSERETLAVVPVVQRLLPRMVACEQQAAFGEIVEAKREHSAQFRERARAVSREESQQNLRIAARRERSFALELFGELSIVVELAVEREPTASVA